MHTVRKDLADFVVCAKLYICDVEFSQIERDGQEFPHIELSNSDIS